MAETGMRRDAPPIGELPKAVNEVLEVFDEHKGEHLVVLDMREISGFTDFMVICGGRNERHVRALADAVLERLGERKVRAGRVEGRARASWILLDYFELVVHVFTPETRRFYQLEKLWREAPMLEWEREESGPDA